MRLGVCGDVFFPLNPFYVLQVVPSLNLINGDVIYNEPNFTTTVDGSNQVFNGIFNTFGVAFTLSTSGVVSGVASCP
jgi:hypothetical protein